MLLSLTEPYCRGQVISETTIGSRSAIFQATCWKKLRWRQSRRTLSWTPCPFTPQAGQGNCFALQATSRSILRLAVSISTLTTSHGDFSPSADVNRASTPTLIAVDGHIVQRVCMAVATACHVDGQAPAYWLCTASRVRFAGQRVAQPALDPVPSLGASTYRAMQVTMKLGIHSGSRHGGRNQLPLKTALGQWCWGGRCYRPRRYIGLGRPERHCLYTWARW